MEPVGRQPGWLRTAGFRARLFEKQTSPGDPYYVSNRLSKAQAASVVELKLSERGQVEEPFFHDGHLTGIMLDEETAHIFLQTMSGGAYKLTLNGVQEFVANDVRAGNIVFDLSILSGAPPPDDFNFDQLLPPPHPSAVKEYQDAHLARRERVLQEIVGGKITLCWISSSYGATVDALCQSVYLESRFSHF